MNFAEVEHRLCHDILEQTEDPMAIEAAVARLLESLDRESLFAVWEVAKNFAEAKEFADRDGDLDVVRSLGAALQPMISWLEGNGIERIADRRPLARDIRSLIGRPFGFLR